MLSNSEIP